MPHHQERPAAALAHGPVKRDDIERVRRDVGRAEDRCAEPDAPDARQVVGQIDAASQMLRADLSPLERALASASATRAVRAG